jgi:hypothetical protein
MPIAKPTAYGAAKLTARLSAIEIAEGALLADVAVLFQVIWMFVPLVGIFFRLLIPIVFTILCLRRGLRASLIALCAAVFLAAIVTGPNIIDLIYLLLEGIGGLYLGFMMRRRSSHTLILALGTAGLTLALYAFTFLLIFLLGTPLQRVLESLQRDYTRLLALVDLAATRLGVEQLWSGQFVPVIAPLVAWAFSYWWLILLGAALANAVPIMLVMYYVTGVFVRVLGYDVRPFPGGWMERRRRQAARRMLRLGLRGYRARRRRAVGGLAQPVTALPAPAEQAERRPEESTV